MTFDPTKSVQTRDGKPARIICTDAKNADGRPMIVLVEVPKGHETAISYAANGRYAAEKHDFDLINVPQKHKRWLNIYSGTNWPFLGTHFATRAEADQEAYPNTRIACIEIEFTEGEGLDP